MEEHFQEFLKANYWNGKHVRSQMKKYAILTRRMGGTYSKTLKTLQRSWTRDVGKYWVRDRKIKRVIELYGQEEQRTDAWHAKRGSMITASEVGSIVEGTPSQRHEVLVRKLTPRVSEPERSTSLTNPLVWGTKFEPIAKRIFERDTNCKIADVSCVQHSSIPFLGASPDGIIKCPDDRERHNTLVEFKCPSSRKIGGEVPRSYYHQMQLQMLCTGVDECEYVEFQFKLVHYTEWKASTATKGMFMIFDDGRIEEWTGTGVQPEDARSAYWLLLGVHRDLVTLQPDWVELHYKKLDDFWTEVKRHREAGTMPDKPGLLKITL